MTADYRDATTRRRFLVSAVGSSGDVHPLVGIGRALHARGHEVIVIASGKFRAVVQGAGLGYREAGTAEQFEQATRDPDLWHPMRGLRRVMTLVGEGLRDQYSAVVACYEPTRTMLVMHPLAFAARVFQEKQASQGPCPGVTLHLAPAGIRTSHAVPSVFPGKPAPPMPLWLRHLIWYGIDRALMDRWLLPSLNALRRAKGLAPISRPFKAWINSPDGVIGLFPPWFGAIQPDWPSNMTLTGFPLFAEQGQHSHDAALEAFLGDGAPPIAATPGSANRHGGAFFRGCIDAAERLGRRIVLLTRYPEQVPAALPPHAHHAAFVPFSQLLPRCCAIIHHGGIGTCAQGLAAGIPQLIHPLGFDQPDNVTRLMRLGVGDFVRPRQFEGATAAAALGALLTSAAVAESCRRWSQRIAASTPVDATCDAIERIAAEHLDQSTAKI